MNAPNIWFCGDTHGSLAHIQRAFDARGGCDAVIHLGDFDLETPLSTQLSPALQAKFWWIPGNHDFDNDTAWRSLHQDALSRHNLHGRVYPVAGLGIAGLGCNFKARVWYPPAPPVHRDPATYAQRLQRQGDALKRTVDSMIWPDMVNTLSRSRADVLVTHEAPSCHRHGFAVLDELAASMQASLLVHGHHHEDYESTVNAGATRVLGVGFRGITTLQGERLLPGAQSNAYWRG